MKEIALKIGKPIPLTAIVSAPKQIDTEKPAVLILNSGIMHHIGACRLSVKIARELAKNDMMSIRFDLSGIGDSSPRTGTASFHETVITEITEVMDYLEQKRKIKKFIAFGLCSGADAAYDIALADERIVGIAQIDPYCYRTTSWYVKHYLPKLFDIGQWIHSFKVRFGAEAKAQAEAKKASDENMDSDNFVMPSYVREFPPRDEVAEGMKKLTDRNVHILSLFTEGQSEILNHSGQFARSFPEVNFKDLLTVDYQDKMDHIITPPDMQRYAQDLVCKWVLQKV